MASIDSPCRMPDFLGIGALKAGTTWLHNVLDQHPDICLPRQRKEIHYFNLYFDRGAEWYRGFFSHCNDGSVKGEITAPYLFEEGCAERIYQSVPGVKLIAILRNPIDQVYSQYKFTIRERGYEGLFVRFIEENARAKEQGRYYEQILRYLKYFPKEQMKILVFDDLVTDPLSAFQTVCRFLDVDDTHVPPNLQQRANVSEIPRFHGLYVQGKRMVRKLYQYDLSWLVQGMKRVGLKRFFFNQKPDRYTFPEITREDYEKLRDYYADDVQKLSVLLDRDLSSLWFKRD